jgi:hypothetical protein
VSVTGCSRIARHVDAEHFDLAGIGREQTDQAASAAQSPGSN